MWRPQSPAVTCDNSPWGIVKWEISQLHLITVDLKQL